MAALPSPFPRTSAGLLPLRVTLTHAAVAPLPRGAQDAPGRCANGTRSDGLARCALSATAQLARALAGGRPRAHLAVGAAASQPVLEKASVARRGVPYCKRWPTCSAAPSPVHIGPFDGALYFSLGPGQPPSCFILEGSRPRCRLIPLSPAAIAARHSRSPGVSRTSMPAEVSASRLGVPTVARPASRSAMAAGRTTRMGPRTVAGVARARCSR